MNEEDSISAITIVVNVIIIIISFYLFFLFVKSKSFHTYPCYNMIIFSFILLLDNILRIIPLSDSDDNHKNFLEYLVAFILVLFDKLILTTLTMHAFIFYLGVAKTKFYFTYEKLLFIIPFLINLVICNIISLVYILHYGIHKSEKKMYHYCNNDSEGKKYADTIFNSFYLFINLYCTINLVVFISRKKKDAESGLIEDLDYKHNFIRILFLFLLNSATFIESYLIIFGKLDGVTADLVYLTTCLLIDIYNSLNKIVYLETMKIFCKKRYEKYEQINELKKLRNASDDYNEQNENDATEMNRQRTDSL